MQINKERSLEIRERQLRKLNEIVKDAEINELNLDKLELEQKAENEKKIIKNIQN